MTSYVSLFAGAGGWDLGCDAAGWECVAQVENDPHAIAVLERHWPNVPRFGDIRDVCVGVRLPEYGLGQRRGRVAHAHVESRNADRDLLRPADVVCFGSPCTDLSVAGQRAGLDGDESGLYWEAVRIIGEMRDGTGNAFPRVCCWENVQGAFSSNDGRDFGAVLDSLAELGALAVEWRLVDGRSWLPQRRARVFVVAVFDPRAASRGEILADAESGSRAAAPIRAAREDVAGTIGGGTAKGGPRTDTDRMTFVPVGPLTAGMGKGPRGTETVDSDHLVLSFAENQRGDVWTSETMDSITAGGGKPGQGYPAIFTVAPNSRQGADLTAVETDVAASFTATDAKMHDRGTRLVDATGVRRLTPLECERLMGWPEDHTRWRADGREIGDSARYRMIGNGVMAPMGEWVARRIGAVL